MKDGQAYVVKERCISCGTCIRECPQGAKAFRNDIEKAVKLIASKKRTAASIAPSFAAVYSDWKQKRIASALRKLGVSYVGETAIGAYHVADDTAKIVAAQKNKSHICTACPAVVSYVEHYDQKNTDLLVPIVSPMLAHAMHIKEKLGEDTGVIFIGPCIAKKAEAERPEHRGIVDCVLTFVELNEWLESESIDLGACEESRFDEEPEGQSRLFPLAGGSIRTASLSTDMLAPDVVSITGFDEICELLGHLGPDGTPKVIEPLFCPQGCVNGPAVPGNLNIYERRQDVLEYANNAKGKEPDSEPRPIALRTKFSPVAGVGESEITEEQIQEVLEKTGKSVPEDQLNCGACGYPSCRDKAIAVIEGMAELDMCVPYMKRLAERRTDKIIETSPNGIVILDERLNIISMNPAFRNLFMCSEAVCGRPISYLMDPDPFEKLASGSEELVETVVRHTRGNLVCHEILYRLTEDRQFVGIFVNITKTRAQKERLDALRAQTVMQARELLEHQINMAQTIAGFLGESTAQSEGLLERLITLAGDENGAPNDSDSQTKYGIEWIRDIYTSK